jgi:hypothetical protein
VRCGALGNDEMMDGDEPCVAARQRDHHGDTADSRSVNYMVVILGRLYYILLLYPSALRNASQEITDHG